MVLYRKVVFWETCLTEQMEVIGNANNSLYDPTLLTHFIQLSVFL